VKVGSDWDSRMLTGNEFQTLGAENRKARDQNVKLWRETESWWKLDELLLFLLLLLVMAFCFRY